MCAMVEIKIKHVRMLKPPSIYVARQLAQDGAGGALEAPGLPTLIASPHLLIVSEACFLFLGSLSVSFEFALFVFCRCLSPWKSMEINASVHCLQVGVSNRPK